MKPLDSPAPELLRLARLLAEVTYYAWPGESDGHFADRAFEEDSDEVDSCAMWNGFEPVGCGNFTAVYSHPDAPGMVFKLNAGTRDRMEEYHRWLMDQDHPNLPRVYHVEGYRGGCVAVAEELEPDGSFWDYDEEYRDVCTLVESAGFTVDDDHSGNIMCRGCTPVLNDPSSNRFAADDQADPYNTTRDTEEVHP